VRLSSSASFSSLAFKIGLTLKFRCALRAIVRGLIRSQSDTMYYRKGLVREESCDYSNYKLCNLVRIRRKYGFPVSGHLRNGI
jgi:hypothetical protein